MEVLRSKHMDDPFKRNAKYGDLYGIPDGTVGELIDGNLYASPRPRINHAMMIGALHLELARFIRDLSPAGWVIVIEPEVRFGQDVLVPDLAGWRRKRMPKVPDVSSIKLAPDWVCEGLSPSTALLDKGRKREVYARSGVPHVWYADPRTQDIDVLRLKGKTYTIVMTATRGRVVIEPFTKTLNLDRMWEQVTAPGS